MRFLYFFALDWNHEIASYERGNVPSHRLFGYAEIRRLGHQVTVCPTPRYFRRWLWKPVVWRIYMALRAVLQQRSVDCIFAVNEASVLPALALKRLGLLKTPVIVFCTGLMHPRNRTGFRKTLWQWCLPSAEAVVSQTSMELEATWKEFGLREDRQHYIPMLVDTKSFKPGNTAEKGDYCLAAGTNEGRDYPTLLKAFPKGKRLVIVTDAYNAAIVERCIEPGMQVDVLQAVSIFKLKALYEQARVVINPLVETDYCSGHTVLLENMALGNPVIIARVKGMRDYVEDGVTALTYPPGDVQDLRKKIRICLDQPETVAHIGRQAAAWVGRFSTEEFARKVIRIATQLVEKSSHEAETRTATAA